MAWLLPTYWDFHTHRVYREWSGKKESVQKSIQCAAVLWAKCLVLARGQRKGPDRLS